jgi:hypothetical protein
MFLPRSISRPLVALLAISMLGLVGNAARADDFAPEMTAFERTSPDLGIPGEPILIEFSATDEGLSGLEWAMFTYRTPIQGIMRVDGYMSHSSSGDFIAKEIVGPWAAEGEYVLEEVELYDRESNHTVYERASAPQFDFAAADFSIENPNEDVTAPIITSARIFESVVPQGQPVVILYTASDDLSGVATVTFSGWKPSRVAYGVTSPPELGAVGPAAWVVPLAAPPGTYESFSAHVIDRAGNGLSYDFDNSTRDQWPNGAQMQDQMPFDGKALSFEVVGGPGDPTPPVVTSFEPLTPRERKLGDQVAIDFAASDEGTGVDRVGFGWSDGHGHTFSVSKQCGDPTHGPAAAFIEPWRTVDRDWTLQSFVVFDKLENGTIYRRDGSVSYASNYVGPTTHSFDLSKGDFHVGEGAGSPTGYTDTTSQWCPVVADVWLGVDRDQIDPGETISAFGSVTTDGGPIAQPVVAIHEYVDGEPRLLEVQRGGAQGDYATAYSPTSSATLKTSFLGYAGPDGEADFTRSNEVDFTVRSDGESDPSTDPEGEPSTGPTEPKRTRRVFIRLSDDAVAVGTRARIRGSVETTAELSKVQLQRRYANGWHTVAKAPLNLFRFHFPIRPKSAGARRYRVLAKPTASFSAGLSRAVTLVVTK